MNCLNNHNRALQKLMLYLLLLEFRVRQGCSYPKPYLGIQLPPINVLVLKASYRKKGNYLGSVQFNILLKIGR